MFFPHRFFAAGTKFTTEERAVPAPLFRRRFTLEERPEAAEILICGLGFYELFLNGVRLTKGYLSPYVSNPDDILYYDRYEVASHLKKGENAVGICLGNGFFNNPFGSVWDFDKASFRGVPRLALSLTADFKGERRTVLADGEGFLTAPSPIVFDDYRAGERYDARLEKQGWTLPGYDDGAWRPAIPADAPKGEPRLCEAEPITAEKELAPVEITEREGGFVYDFGENNAGVCRLTLRGEPGRTVTLRYGERLKDGRPDPDENLFGPWLPHRDLLHTDCYTCRGGGVETYQPSFTYHGFRYVFVTGITKEQATPELLTFVVLHTRLRERGGFVCSDPVLNRLQDMTRRSTVSNFHHFPTDCPHREKNGWTGDARLSAEQTLMNFEPDRNYREWLRGIVKAQAPSGALPGIVPTSGWGFHWGNGPAWDGILAELPYQLFRLRGDLSAAAECADAMVRYIRYLAGRVGPDGLVAIGLGDWCPVGRECDAYKSPLCLTDTLVSMDICRKTACLLGKLGREEEQEAQDLYRRLRTAGRERLIDFSAMTAAGRCQTSQAMAIACDLFDPDEKPEAFRVLLDLIREQGDHMDVGVLGGRALFDVLADFGRADLALRMIGRPDYPSFGEWALRGETTLRESFSPEPDGSLNHHFWGDISRFFIQRIAGIRLGEGRLSLEPGFGCGLTWAEGWHEAPQGRIGIRWEERDGAAAVEICVPAGLPAVLRLPRGYVFADTGEGERTGAKGRFAVKRAEQSA